MRREILALSEVWQELMIDLAQDRLAGKSRLLAQFSPGPVTKGSISWFWSLSVYLCSHLEPQVWLSQLAHDLTFNQDRALSDSLLPEWQADLSHAQHLLEQALADLESLTNAMISKLQPLGEQRQVQALQTV